MKKRDYIYIWFAVVLVLVVILFTQTAPGYMDAEYYYSMGLRIANDNSLKEPFVWNYFDGQREVPHSGFTYWQPLPAFLAAGGLLLFGGSAFVSARILFLLLYSFVPLITCKLTWDLTGQRDTSLLAAVFSIFPVFYAPFIGTTDAFGVLMLLGGIYFLGLMRRERSGFIVLWGAVAGLIHLTRAEGLIWLAAGLLLSLLDEKKLKNASLFGLGYLLVMGPWFARNLVELGSLLPSGTSRMFWLTEYNDLFNFNPSLLNFKAWSNQGLQQILSNIAQAFLANLKTTGIVQGQIILAPFAIYGIWSKRQNRAIQAGLIIFSLIFVLMTVVFPFAGWRGGFFHAGAGLQTMIWAVSAHGFGLLIDRAVAKRNWTRIRSMRMFGAGIAVIFLVASGYIYRDKVYGEDPQHPAWNRSEAGAMLVDSQLGELNIPETELVMINNPPGLYAAAKRSSIVIPNGPVDDVIKAASEFGVKILILEANHPPQLDAVYLHPNTHEGLLWLASSDGIHVFKITDPSP